MYPPPGARLESNRKLVLPVPLFGGGGAMTGPPDFWSDTAVSVMLCDDRFFPAESHSSSLIGTVLPESLNGAPGLYSRHTAYCTTKCVTAVTALPSESITVNVAVYRPGAHWCAVPGGCRSTRSPVAVV